jgi:hypothetical protein
MNKDDTVYLKDGTKWDDEKSDEFVDSFIDRIRRSSKEGHRIVSAKDKNKVLRAKYHVGPQKKYSISIKHLPKKLQKDLENLN